MISIFSLYTWDVSGKVVSGLTGYYSGTVDVIPSQNLLITCENVIARPDKYYLLFLCIDTVTIKFCTELTIDKCYKMHIRAVP